MTRGRLSAGRGEFPLVPRRGKSRYLIGGASRRHFVNVTSWSARASFFAFPKHTGDKVRFPPVPVMYITDGIC